MKTTNIKQDERYVKNFGYLLTFVFFIFFLFPIIKDASINFWAGALSFISLLITIFNKKLLNWPAYAWFQFGKLLHIIISPIILFVVYFFSIIIIGFLIKIFGKDPLEKKYVSGKKSYWIKKNQNLTALDIFNQY